MKKALIITLGILNIIAFISMLLLLGIPLSQVGSVIEYFSLWGLPFIIVAAYTLTIGIRTLKGKHWIWAIWGLILTGAAWYYFYWLAALSEWYIPFFNLV